jgi:hypothetical protein
MNRFVILTLLLPLFIMVSCERDRPPKDLLEKDEMIPLLIDLHMAYAIQSSVQFRKISLDVDTVDTYTYIFDKHGVQKAVFDSSVAWYSRHPKRFTEIYDEVVMDLTQMRDSLEVMETK